MARSREATGEVLRDVGDGVLLMDGTVVEMKQTEVHCCARAGVLATGASGRSVDMLPLPNTARLLP